MYNGLRFVGSFAAALDEADAVRLSFPVTFGDTPVVVGLWTEFRDGASHDLLPPFGATLELSDQSSLFGLPSM